MASNSFGSGGAAAMTSAPVSASVAAAAAAAAAVNADLWRECVAWLVRCKVIPADHKAALPDAEIRILAMTLRDGVLLCNLVIHLDPSSMDAREFNRKPQMAQVSESREAEGGRKLIKVFVSVSGYSFCAARTSSCSWMCVTIISTYGMRIYSSQQCSTICPTSIGCSSHSRSSRSAERCSKCIRNCCKLTSRLPPPPPACLEGPLANRYFALLFALQRF